MKAITYGLAQAFVSRLRQRPPWRATPMNFIGTQRVSGRLDFRRCTHWLRGTARTNCCRRFGAAAVGGAISGIIQTALPGVGTAAVMSAGALSGAASGVTERLAASV